MTGQTSWSKALGLRFDIHEAIATGTPYSVCILAWGADFLYREGHLCYRVGHEIRLLDVHGSSRQERVLNLDIVLSRLVGSFGGRVTLLHYSDDIVTFRLGSSDGEDGTLVAVDMTRRCDDTKGKRLLLQKSVPADGPIVVRHCRSYIWYSTFAATNSSVGTWSVHGVDFATMEEVSFSLDRVADPDLGQTLCFEMIQEHFYAVSTQSTSDDENSSFYHWFCHAPRQKEQKWNGRLWRRQHREGPIHELWADLAIRIDEVTGSPVIVECRREWQDGSSSENHRTIYTEALPTPEEAKAWADEDHYDLDSIHHPYDDRPEKRLRRDHHAEFEPDDEHTLRHEFMPAHTKHRTYHLAASTFIDLVNDPVPIPGSVRTRGSLRLRTVSRKRKCPLDEEGLEAEPGMLLPASRSENGRPVDGSEERFVSRGVHMWPSRDAPAELQQLLCPDSKTDCARAISDERSLIYSVSAPGLPLDHQALVLISFDPTIRFSNFTSLRTLKGPMKRDNMFPVGMSPPLSSGLTLMTEVQPLYQAIDRGYWLR